MRDLSRQGWKTEATNPVDEIIELFDFEKVQLMMSAVGWHWGIAGERDLRTPTVSEIQEVAKDLLQRVVADPECMSIGTGGLRAERRDGFLHLTFVGEHATGHVPL